MRKSIRHFSTERTGRAQDANLVETFATRNENCAAAESSRQDNSSHFALLFVRLSLTILYAWSNSPLALELREWVRELSESDISLRYALDWRPSSQEHLFPFSSARRSPLFIRLSTLWVLQGRENPPCQRRWCEKLAGNYFVGCIFDGSSRLADKSRRGTDVDFRTRINVLVREEI